MGTTVLPLKGRRKQRREGGSRRIKTEDEARYRCRAGERERERKRTRCDEIINIKEDREVERERERDRTTTKESTNETRGEIINIGRDRKTRSGVALLFEGCKGARIAGSRSGPKQE